MGEARIFTKVDIRQAFRRICMGPAKAASLTKSLFIPVAMLTGKLCEDVSKDVELLDELLQSNKSDAELEAYRKLAREKLGGWSFTEQGLLLKGDRLFVPERNNLRTRVLEYIHLVKALCHPGRNMMRRLVSDRNFWPRHMGDVVRQKLLDGQEVPIHTR